MMRLLVPRLAKAVQRGSTAAGQIGFSFRPTATSAPVAVKAGVPAWIRVAPYVRDGKLVQGHQRQVTHAPGETFRQADQSPHLPHNWTESTLATWYDFAGWRHRDQRTPPSAWSADDKAALRPAFAKHLNTDEGPGGHFYSDGRIGWDSLDPKADEARVIASWLNLHPNHDQIGGHRARSPHGQREAADAAQKLHNERMASGRSFLDGTHPDRHLVSSETLKRLRDGFFAGKGGITEAVDAAEQEIAAGHRARASASAAHDDELADLFHGNRDQFESLSRVLQDRGRSRHRHLTVKALGLSNTAAEAGDTDTWRMLQDSIYRRPGSKLLTEAIRIAEAKPSPAAPVAPAVPALARDGEEWVATRADGSTQRFKAKGDARKWSLGIPIPGVTSLYSSPPRRRMSGKTRAAMEAALGPAPAPASSRRGGA